MNKQLSFLAVAVLAGTMAACGSDNSGPGPAVITSFSQAESWTCLPNINCQDVWDIHFEAGSVATFKATDVTGGSIVGLALYAPGSPLGGINLFTSTTSEYRCGAVTDCDSQPEGQLVGNFIVAEGGTYRLAITRDWSESCGGNGTYRLAITSDKGFSKPTRTVNDKQSLATGVECP